MKGAYRWCPVEEGKITKECDIIFYLVFSRYKREGGWFGIPRSRLCAPKYNRVKLTTCKTEPSYKYIMISRYKKEQKRD